MSAKRRYLTHWDYIALAKLWEHQFARHQVTELTLDVSLNLLLAAHQHVEIIRILTRQVVYVLRLGIGQPSATLLCRSQQPRRLLEQLEELTPSGLLHLVAHLNKLSHVVARVTLLRPVPAIQPVRFNRSVGRTNQAVPRRRNVLLNREPPSTPCSGENNLLVQLSQLVTHRTGVVIPQQFAQHVHRVHREKVNLQADRRAIRQQERAFRNRRVALGVPQQRLWYVKFAR